jgi:hypothetical protein
MNFLLHIITFLSCFSFHLIGKCAEYERIEQVEPFPLHGPSENAVALETAPRTDLRFGAQKKLLALDTTLLTVLNSG